MRIGSNEPHVLSSQEVRLLDTRQEIRLSRSWGLKRVPSGTIWFEALVNETVTMRVPFMVEIVPPPSAELQA